MRVPKYSHHKATGQAYVKLGGKFVYLGKYGAEESRRKYEETIGAWLTNGRKPPATPKSAERVGVTVGGLIAAYLEHCREYYAKNGKPTGEYNLHRYLRKKVASIADLPANAISPAILEQLRGEWVAQGNCRKYINKNVSRIVRMFRWAVTKDLVDVDVWRKLTALDGLKAGRCKAKERAPITAVDDATFEAACERMPDETAAMARIQRLTGARPGEMSLCGQRTSTAAATFGRTHRQVIRRSITERTEPSTLAHGRSGYYCRSCCDQPMIFAFDDLRVRRGTASVTAMRFI